MKDLLSARNRFTNNFSFVIVAAVVTVIFTSILFLTLIRVKHRQVHVPVKAAHGASASFAALQAQFLNVDTAYDAYAALAAKHTAIPGRKRTSAAHGYAKQVLSLHRAMDRVEATLDTPQEHTVFTKIRADIASYERHAHANIVRLEHRSKHPGAHAGASDAAVDSDALSEDFDTLDGLIANAAVPVEPPVSAASNMPQFVLLGGALLFLTILGVGIVRKRRNPAPEPELETPPTLLHYINDTPPPTKMTIEERPMPPAQSIEERHVRIIEKLGTRSQELSTRLHALNEAADSAIALAQSLTEHHPELGADPRFTVMVEHSHTLAAEMLMTVKNLRRSSTNMQQHVMQMVALMDADVAASQTHRQQESTP